MILDSIGQHKLLMCIFNSRSPGRGFHHYLMTMRDEFKPFVQFELQDALAKYNIRMADNNGKVAISWDDEAFIDLYVDVLDSSGKRSPAIIPLAIDDFRWPKYASFDDNNKEVEIHFKPEDFE